MERVFCRTPVLTRKFVAGYGTNGLFDFNCWSYEPTNIYTWYNQVKCDAVYDCNHQQQAGDGPDAPGPMESPEQE